MEPKGIATVRSIASKTLSTPINARYGMYARASEAPKSTILKNFLKIFTGFRVAYKP
jgi:hypothetical protein